MIYEIWQIIESEPFYQGNTYLFISPDHERNSYYMDHFENPPENPSNVWMYVYGPKVKKGVVIDNVVHHVDMFQTIAVIMIFINCV